MADLSEIGTWTTAAALSSDSLHASFAAGLRASLSGNGSGPIQTLLSIVTQVVCGPRHASCVSYVVAAWSGNGNGSGPTGTRTATRVVACVSYVSYAAAAVNGSGSGNGTSVDGPPGQSGKVALNGTGTGTGRGNGTGTPSASSSAAGGHRDATHAAAVTIPARSGWTYAHVSPIARAGLSSESSLLAGPCSGCSPGAGLSYECFPQFGTSHGETDSCGDHRAESPMGSTAALLPGAAAASPVS